MQEIKDHLKKVIQDLYGLDITPELTPSPDNINTDYSSNAPLKLAKELHKSPMEIAKDLCEALENSAFEEHVFRRGKRGATEPRDGGREGAFRKSTISSAPTPPGFINFTLPDDYLLFSIENLNKAPRSITSNELSGKTVICEFSDPNPFKVLHVGHLYTSIVGDSISRLFEYAGAKVIRANFGGDVGLHVAKTMYILRQKNLNDLTIDDISRCYIEGTAAYEDNEEAKAEINVLNKEIYRINSEDLHDSDLAKLYWRGRELSYDYFNDFYNSIGVKFDKYYPESSVANLGHDKVKSELKKGVYEVSQGAVVFNGDKYGLHTRVFINQEGVPTYEAKDVGLIFQKDADYHYDKSIVITGSEQLEYMKVVLKSIAQYAPELVAKTTHLIHGMVRLPGNIKMSSRKGNFLKATDVINMVKDELKKEHNSSDEKVSLAATKYAFLKYKMGGDIVFNPKESVKMTGNSGPYLLYSCVRAKKILQKASNESKNKNSASTNGRGEQNGNLGPSERDLIKKLSEYTSALNEAVTEMAPHKVANFLYELAQLFSRFYENCEVVGSDQEAERIKLVEAYLNTMTHGLGLLGIEIPEEM